MFTHIFLNGTVGAGKSTTADEIAVILAESGISHAVIDLDTLRRNWPCSPDDPFNHEVELHNLASVAQTYLSAGVELIVLAGVLEDRGELARYVAACGGGPMKICRLIVDEAVGKARLRVRHSTSEAELEWHLDRFKELSAIIDNAAAYDEEFDTTGMNVRDVAVAVVNFSNPGLLPTLYPSAN